MKKRDRFFLCTIIPMIVVFFLFHTFPLLKGGMYSFTNFRGFGDFDFIGLMNFKDLFTDSRVINSYMFTFKFAIVTTIIVNLISLTLALALKKGTLEMIEKEKRHQLFENDDIVLEQRGNHYYLSLFDKDGKFQREVNITVKDDFKVTIYNDKS